MSRLWGDAVIVVNTYEIPRINRPRSSNFSTESLLRINNKYTISLTYLFVTCVCHGSSYNTYVKLKGINKSLQRLLRGKRVRLYLPILLAAVLIVFTNIYSSSRVTKIDPQSYASLLDTIAKGESRGSYNAYFGNASNTEIDFTSMTVGNLLRWQEEYVKSGSPSSAVGKYQIIRPTLVSLVDELKIENGALFDSALQDRMAIALLERRGSLKYVENKISREQFAANLAQEWAALPKVIGEDSGKSYYASDGLNQAHIDVDEVLGAVDQIRRM